MSRWWPFGSRTDGSSSAPAKSWWPKRPPRGALAELTSGGDVVIHTHGLPLTDRDCEALADLVAAALVGAFPGSVGRGLVRWHRIPRGVVVELDDAGCGESAPRRASVVVEE